MWLKIKNSFKTAIFGKWIGNLVRHSLTALGGILVGNGLATPEVADQATSGVIQLLTSPEFLNGIGVLLMGLGTSGSAANTVVQQRKLDNEQDPKKQ